MYFTVRTRTQNLDELVPAVQPRRLRSLHFEEPVRRAYTMGRSLVAQALVTILLLADIPVETGALRCPGVTIVSRKDWGARRPRLQVAMRNPRAQYVFIHHTTGPQCKDKSSCSRLIRSHQNHHMNANRWPDIGYNFLVGGDSRIYEGRGIGREGAHTRGYNQIGIAISFVGDFSRAKPNLRMRWAAKRLIACGVRQARCICYGTILNVGQLIVEFAILLVRIVQRVCYGVPDWLKFQPLHDGHNMAALTDVQNSTYGAMFENSEIDFSQGVKRAERTGKINKRYTLHGHRDANCTSCPGYLLYAIIKKWAHFKGRLKRFFC